MTLAAFGSIIVRPIIRVTSEGELTTPVVEVAGPRVKGPRIFLTTQRKLRPQVPPTRRLRRCLIGSVRDLFNFPRTDFTRPYFGVGAMASAVQWMWSDLLPKPVDANPPAMGCCGRRWIT